MVARIGCLGILAVWAIAGVYMHFTDRFGEDGGTRYAMMGLFGLAVLVVGSVIESLTTRGRRERRGFPVEPLPREDEP